MSRAIDVARLLGLWRSPKLWMVLSALANRGTGFLASFLIARWLGPAALGVYSSTVNTAAAVAQPALGVISNGAALSSHEGAASLGMRALVRAFAGWGLLATVLLGPLLGQMLWATDMAAHAGEGFPPLALLAVGLLVMWGQVALMANTALLSGAGQFLLVARASCVASALLMAVALPAVAWGGLLGALGLAAAAACLPAVLLMALAWRLPSPAQGARSGPSAWQLSGQHIKASAPNVAALLLNSGVNWLCTIYLVQQHHGHVGVAVVAVASQWLNLMLMPVTSWGGMVLKELLDAHGDKATPGPVRWAVVARLCARNLAVTGAVVAAIVLASGLIARAYGLAQAGLQDMLWVFGAAALSLAVLNVLERLYVCRERQFDWMCLSALGLLLQLGVSWWWMAQGLWVVSIGILLANVATALLAVAWLGLAKAGAKGRA